MLKLVNSCGSLLLLACVTSREALPFDLPSAAEDVTKGYGTATLYKGDQGAPVFILEEFHQSYKTNLQEAVMLMRLHEKYHLNDIGLEGYLQEDAPLWPTGFTPDPRSALFLIKQGEISSAEFMALGYGVVVHPIEHSADYVKYSGQYDPARSYLTAIALKRFNDKRREGSLPSGVEKQAETLISEHKYDELKQLVEGQDPFVVQSLPRLQQMMSLKSRADWNIETQIALFERINTEASSVGANVQESRQDMNNYLRYLHARQAATVTMSHSAGQIANDVPILAIIIGAGHTEGVVRILTEEKRPVVLITANNVGKSDPTDLSREEYAAKGAQEPINRGPLERAIENAFFGDMKQKPAMLKKWPLMEAELYVTLDDINHLAFFPQPADKADCGNQAKEDGAFAKPIPKIANVEKFRKCLSDKSFNSRYFSVDPGKIEVVAEGEHDTLLFPVVIMNPDDNRKSEVWVKLGPGAAALAGQKPTEVLAELSQAIEKAPSRLPEKPSVEKKDITLDTAVMLADKRDDAVNNTLYGN